MKPAILLTICLLLSGCSNKYAKPLVSEQAGCASYSDCIERAQKFKEDDFRTQDEKNGKYYCLMRGGNGWYGYAGYKSQGYRFGSPASYGPVYNSKVVYGEKFTQEMWNSLQTGDIGCVEKQ